ncbi:MAG: DinB family protein [Clostridia bacterium]|nr:DinB family protein [Clostridia bacterium]MCL6522992.1 DinB family protein [Bacillota bacterium]
MSTAAGPGADPAVRAIRVALEEVPAHVRPEVALEALGTAAAGRRPEGAPYTVHQLLGHLIFWLDFALAQLRGEEPQQPAHAEEGWPFPPAPPSQEELDGAVAHFLATLGEVNRYLPRWQEPVRGSRRLVGELLTDLAIHNSYHLGQIVLLRRQIGDWPPPSGGDTW